MWTYEKTELADDFGRLEDSDKQSFKTKKEAIQYAEDNHHFKIRKSCMKYADKVELLGFFFCLAVVSVLLIMWEGLWFSGTVIRLVFILTLVLTPATTLGIGLYLIGRHRR